MQESCITPARTFDYYGGHRPAVCTPGAIPHAHNREPASRGRKRFGLVNDLLRAAHHVFLALIIWNLRRPRGLSRDPPEIFLHLMVFQVGEGKRAPKLANAIGGRETRLPERYDTFNLHSVFDQVYCQNGRNSAAKRVSGHVGLISRLQMRLQVVEHCARRGVETAKINLSSFAGRFLRSSPRGSQAKRRHWMPRAALFIASSIVFLSSGDSCGRSILIVSLLNFAVSGNGGR
jgi:hypothetical protein